MSTLSLPVRAGIGLALVAGGLAWALWSMVGPRDGLGDLSLPLRAFPGPADARRDPAIVFLTSDSGWLRFNRRLPAWLARSGHETIVWNSLSYYLDRRTPDEASADLAWILDALQARGHQRFYLIGYSFGAGVLPALVNRLPAEMRARVQGVALLAFPGSASFRFSVEGWFRVPADAVPTRAEVEQLRLPVLCIAGRDDPMRDCRSIQDLSTMRLVPGQHRLGPASPLVQDLIAEHIRLTNPGPE